MSWLKYHTARHNPWLHAGFWAAWVVFFTLLQSLGQGSNSLLTWFLYYLGTLPVFVIHTYLIAYWLVPVAFWKSRYGWFITGLIILLLVFSAIELIMSNELVFEGGNPAMAADDGYLNPRNIIISGIGNHYIILVFMAIKVGKAWYGAKATEEEEKQRNLKTAIEIYNYQFRPKVIYHLMTLLECGIKKDIKKASGFIILISDFLNGFLNDKNNQEENLSEEIELIEKYIEIYASVLPDKIRTTYSSEGNFALFSAPGYLFLPIIDYAFSLGKWCNNVCSCSVFIREMNNDLLFSVCLSSEKKLCWQNSLDSEMLSKRLGKMFPDNVRLREEKGETFWKLEADVFCQ